LSDAPFARYLADNGRAHAARFTLEEHTRRLLDFYRRVTAPGQS
jgi:glycosyltransferase involved in cell wall biosynthesis